MEACKMKIKDIAAKIEPEKGVTTSLQEMRLTDF